MPGMSFSRNLLLKLAGWTGGVCFFLGVCSLPLTAGNWPAWRGDVAGTGATEDSGIPLEWSSSKNIRWKQPLPERGNSTPIIWEDRVFLTQAIESEDKRLLMCLDRKNGRVLWKKGATWTQEERSHRTNPFCSASPVTDGDRVIAWFGSAGVFAYDFKGNELWHRDLGIQDHEWGYGGSPVIYKNLCILFFGPGKGQTLLALDKRTGKTVWKVEPDAIEKRPRTDGFRGNEGNGKVGAFGTPILVNVDGHAELVMSFAQRLRAYDPMTGKELWNCDGMNELVYTSAIAGEGHVVGTGGYLGTAMAVKAGGRGDVTDTHRQWRFERTKNRIGSGVIYKGHIYLLNSDGIAECFELVTGKRIWQERLPSKGPTSESWSCLTLVGDRIYVPNQSGDVVVFRASTKFEVLAINGVGNELTNASLAVSDGDLFLRTHKNIYCISEKEN